MATGKQEETHEHTKEANSSRSFESFTMGSEPQPMHFELYPIPLMASADPTLPDAGQKLSNVFGVGPAILLELWTLP